MNWITCPVCGKEHDYESCLSPNGLCAGCEMQELMKRDRYIHRRFDELQKAEHRAILTTAKEAQHATDNQKHRN